jgi:hypothetical protein
MKKYLDKWLNQTREEEIIEMSNALNGKPTYSDSEIAMGMAFLCKTKYYKL